MREPLQIVPSLVHSARSLQWENKLYPWFITFFSLIQTDKGKSIMQNKFLGQKMESLLQVKTKDILLQRRNAPLFQSHITLQMSE